MGTPLALQQRTCTIRSREWLFAECLLLIITPKLAAIRCICLEINRVSLINFGLSITDLYRGLPRIFSLRQLGAYLHLAANVMSEFVTCMAMFCGAFSCFSNLIECYLARGSRLI